MPETQQGFNRTAYLGTWYEQYHSKEFFWSGDSDVCTTAKYTANKDGSIGVDNSGQSGQFRHPEKGHFGKRSGVKGEAICSDEKGAPAKCSVGFFGQTPPNPAKAPNYNVLWTDYSNWTVIYSCNDGIQLPIVWILSRIPTPDRDQLK